MKLLIDNKLPIQLAVHLRKRGHDCDHVADIGMDEATDLELWTAAMRQSRILVSKDEDFVLPANRPGDSGRLIWVRVGNCRNAALRATFDRVHAELVAAMDGGKRILEVR